MSNETTIPETISGRAARIVRALRDVPQSTEWGESPSLDEAICAYVAVLKRESVPAEQAEILLERALDASASESGVDSRDADKAVLAYCMSKFYDDAA
jgi:hypothetical protein